MKRAALVALPSTRAATVPGSALRIVRRPLLARLVQAGRRRCVILQGPAGSGKTSAFSMWRPELMSVGVEVAWLASGTGCKDPPASRRDSRPMPKQNLVFHPRARSISVVRPGDLVDGLYELRFLPSNPPTTPPSAGELDVLASIDAGSQRMGTGNCVLRPGQRKSAAWSRVDNVGAIESADVDQEVCPWRRGSMGLSRIRSSIRGARSARARSVGSGRCWVAGFGQWPGR